MCTPLTDVARCGFPYMARQVTIPGVQESIGVCAKCAGQFLQIINTDTDFPALDRADVGSVQPAVFRQLFLAPAVEQSKQAQVQ